jgi:4-phospho-D-threonate 3-dehydrogenase / 4-phospho-D-erythronate 3-dehydrogenase
LKPILALSMGDAAGIGPELIAKVLAQPSSADVCYPLVVGDPSAMGAAASMVGAGLRFREVGQPAEARFAWPEVDVLCPKEARIGPARWGALDPALGRAAAVCLQGAFELALAGHAAGVVSAPLNKEAFHLAGYAYSDELAFLAELSASPEAFILGAMEPVWTVAVTEHVAFREIPDRVTEAGVLGRTRQLHDALRKLGFAAPRIAIAALNVHGGEGGLYGREEIDQIAPAVRAARAQGIDAHGPFPADTVFVSALAGRFDGVVCMYHDQANIARKLHARRGGATIFMGLPVACGTTAHGTAFDIAGQGVADPGSLLAALRYTALLSAS